MFLFSSIIFIQLVVWDKVSGDVVNLESVNNPRFATTHGNKLLVSTFGIQKQLLYTINDDGTLTQVSVDIFSDISQSLSNAFYNGNMYMTGTGSDGARSIFEYDENNNHVITIDTQHTSFISEIRFYGDYLISNSKDKTMKIWNHQTQTLVKTIDLQVLSNAMDVKDGYIFNFNRDDGTIDIRDFEKVINENDDEPITRIPVPYDYAGNGQDATGLYFDSELQQLVLHGSGRAFYWEYSTGSESGNDVVIEDPIPASIAAGVNWVQLSSGKYIHVGQSTMQWQESRDYCYGLFDGATMAVPTDDEENTEMHSVMKQLVSSNEDFVWLGIQREVGSAEYYRTDGEPLSYENWCPGEHPGGETGSWVNGGDDRALMYPYSYQDQSCWNDLTNDFPFYVKAGCQYDPNASR